MIASLSGIPYVFIAAETGGDRIGLTRVSVLL